MNTNKQLDILIIDYLENQLSEENKVAFEKTIASSPELQDYIADFKMMWNNDHANTTDFNAEQAFEKLQQKVDTATPTTEKHVKLRSFLKVAAIITIAITSSFSAFKIGSQYATNNQTITIASLTNEKSAIMLPDSTKVYLNASSSISYKGKLNKKLREVHLTGEAYFEVKSDKAHPFIVHAHDVQIKATGTKFNVNAYDEEFFVKTGLVEGIVKITANEKSYKMKPGDIISVNKKSFNMRHKTMLSNDEVTAWRSNKIMFRNDKIGESIPQFERFFGINIIASPEVRNIRFSGTFDNESIDDLMIIFRDILGIDATKENNTIHLQNPS